MYTFDAASLRNRSYVYRVKGISLRSRGQSASRMRVTLLIFQLDLVQVDVRACAAREGTSSDYVDDSEATLTVSLPGLSLAIFVQREDRRVSAMPTDTLEDSRVLQDIVVHPLR